MQIYLLNPHKWQNLSKTDQCIQEFGLRKYLVGTVPYTITHCSVADPGCLSRIQIFPSRIQGQKDSGPESASKNLSILTFIPKKLFLRSRIRILIFTYPGSRCQKAPDPGSASLPHCIPSSLYKIISWVNRAGRIFWVAIPTLLPLLPSSRYVTSQLGSKHTFSRRETLLFWTFFVFACVASWDTLVQHPGLLHGCSPASRYLFHSHTEFYPTVRIWIRSDRHHFAGSGSLSIPTKCKPKTIHIKSMTLMTLTRNVKQC